MGMPFGFAEALARKYQILQQEADAKTANASTNTLTGAAAANLDTVRGRLLPGQIASDIAKTNAETGLVGQQAKYFGQSALANIANLNASTRSTDVNAAVARREGLDSTSADSASLEAIRRLRGDAGQAAAFARLNPTFQLGSGFNKVLGEKTNPYGFGF